MVFELLEKKRSNTLGLQPNQISIARSGTISFGTEMLSHLDKEGFIEIYLDRKNKRVGFKPTSNNFNGFKIQMTTGGKTAHIVSKMVKDLLPSGKYEAKTEEGFVVIEVLEIVDNTKTTIIK